MQKLLRAIQEGKKEEVAQKVKDKGANLNWQEEGSQWAAIHVACWANQGALLSLLLSRDDLSLNLTDLHGRSPLAFLSFPFFPFYPFYPFSLSFWSPLVFHLLCCLLALAFLLLSPPLLSPLFLSSSLCPCSLSPFVSLLLITFIINAIISGSPASTAMPRSLNSS